MPKCHVICTHPRAGAKINNIAFEKHDKGKRTVEPVESDVAKQFEGFDFFQIVPFEEKPPKKPKQQGDGGSGAAGDAGDSGSGASGGGAAGDGSGNGSTTLV